MNYSIGCECAACTMGRMRAEAAQREASEKIKAAAKAMRDRFDSACEKTYPCGAPKDTTESKVQEENNGN